MQRATTHQYYLARVALRRAIIILAICAILFVAELVILVTKIL